MRKNIILLVIIIQSILISSQELVEVGSWEYGPTEAVAVKDSTAYISSGSYLWVLDISNESNISLVDEIKLDSYINFIRRIGNYIYVAKEDSIINIYDIHNPTNISLSNQIHGMNPFFDISVYGDTLYLGCKIPFNPNNRIGEYYINDTVNPVLNRYIFESYALYRESDIGVGYIENDLMVYDMSVSGHIFSYNDILVHTDYVRGISTKLPYIYYGNASNGVAIAEVITVDSLVKKGNTPTGGITYDVELIEDTLLIAGKGTKGIGIYDIENDTILTLIGECDTDGFVYEIEVMGDRLYAGARSGGLIIIDISDKSNPTVLGEYRGHGEIRGIDIHNNRLYAAGADGGLSIFDISGGSNMNLISQTYTRYISEDVSVDDSFAYIAEGDSGLTILDITDENNPSIIGYLIYYTNHVGHYLNTCIIGGNMDVGQIKIVSVDVSNKNNPFIADTLLNGREITQFCVDDSMVYCISYYLDRFCEQYKIVRSDSVVLMNSLQEDNTWFRNVFADSSLLFLSINSRDSIKCYDASSTDSMINISNITTESFGYRMSYHNNYLYELVYDSWNIYVYNYQDPYNPTEIDVYPFGYSSEGMDNNGQYLYMGVSGGVAGSNLDRGRFGARIFTVGIPGVDENRKDIYRDVSVITTINSIQIQNNTNTTQTYQITDITGRVIDDITVKQGLNTYTPKQSGIYFVMNKNNETIGKAIIVK